MKHPVTVRVRFCGGCNPEIDRGVIVKQLIKLLSDKPVKWLLDANSETAADLILHVNGCAHACLDEETESTVTEKVISIQGQRLDRKTVPEADLVEKVAEKLISICNGRNHWVPY